MEIANKNTGGFITICSILIAVLLVLGTIWMGSGSKKDNRTEQ